MDEIINKIIEYNKEIQILTSIDLCNNTLRTPRPCICSNVTENNYDEWNKYYTIENNKNLFSKGYERLNTWIHLFNDKPILYFTKKIFPKTQEEKYLFTELMNKLNYIRKNKKVEYLFILSALIIIFQVFGDGNHRTAKYFMKINGGNISKKQEEMINNILRVNDYFTISNNSIEQMNNIINQLVNISRVSI